MARAVRDWAKIAPYDKRLKDMDARLPGAGSLKTAWLFVHDCASCSDMFAQSCNNAQNSLDEAATQIKNGKLE